MVELITVLVVVGILGAVGAVRFFDNRVFENRAYADQAKAIVRYAQKLAVVQNRRMFVRSNGNSFAVCAAAACGGNDVIASPAGTNSGSKSTKLYCQQTGGYAARWMCEGRPSSVTVGATGNGGLGVVSFFFDPLGRPFNSADNGQVSSFQDMTLTFTSGANTASFVVYAETGYVQ
jgi:MSHA pilin protein MshC